MKFHHLFQKVNHKLLSMKAYLKALNTQQKICNSARKTFIQTNKMRKRVIKYLRYKNKIWFLNLA